MLSILTRAGEYDVTSDGCVRMSSSKIGLRRSSIHDQRGRGVRSMPAMVQKEEVPRKLASEGKGRNEVPLVDSLSLTWHPAR